MTFRVACHRLCFSLLVLLGGVSSGSLRADPLVEAANSIYSGIRMETLPNGLIVYLKPIPGSPVVTTKVAYRVGSADEELASTGLSHYLEHLMFKGTAKLMPGDIDRLTQINGGRNNANTSEDCTVYHFDFAADRWTVALDIEADRMRGTVIDAKHEFEQEKGAVIAELEGGEDEPWEKEQKTILPLLFGKTAPYGHPVIGEREHVRNATAEIIKTHYDRWYHPNNAIIAVVGGFDPDQAMAEIRKRFANIPKGELPARRPIPDIAPRTETVRVEIPSKFELPRLVMGYNGVTVGHPDDYAFDVISQVLTGGKTGRLYRKLVEGEQIATSVSAFNSAGRYPGWFGVMLELMPNGDRAKAEKLLLAEIERLAAEPITAAELKRAQRAVLASTIFGSEDNHSLADRIARSAIMDPNGSIDYPRTYLSKIQAVTPEQVQAAARKWLVEAKPVMVWSVPGEQQPPQGMGNASQANPLRRNILARKGLRHREAPQASGGGSFPELKNAQRVTLPNGMRVVLLENHRLPIVVATVANPRADLLEPANQHGVASMLALLLDEGTTTKTGQQIASMVEDTGGEFSLGVSQSSLQMLSSDAELGLSLMFECLQSPAFPAESVERMRLQLVSAIEDSERDPNETALTAFRKTVYGDHPYGRPGLGNREVVKKLTVDDLKAYHATIMRPSELITVIVGDFDSKSMVTLLQKLVPTPEKPQLPVALELPKPPTIEQVTEKIISNPNAAQLHVYLGHLGIARNDPDYFKLLVMDNVLGTGPGFTDRLSASLRDRQGLAYTVTAQITGTASDGPGVFQGYIGTFPDKLATVKAGFLTEINRIRDELPDEAEVENAKKYLLGTLAFRTATNQMIAGQLLGFERFGLGLDYLERYRKEVAAVTPMNVQAMAKKHLQPGRLVLTACGPVDATGKPLAAPKP
ncbi:M16 family metallopeptidase [Tuwongella immobilis]|uniref:Peptidase M16 C-terminal domain-containing protein n=1 Tax=Tuwongella immobilis TaxID=692036 RepID=A0A6C2YMT0_9BACT|nr:pitrilysin family protein [Tuwongella immobilis]VIP02375.1 peptidase m16 domain-containing protein : Putative Zn-dependent peptidase OS=Singulisphaera acidiphila (strain ATCC BAA-1392 / DSM 18658 / VKM B-2454 / MOB10) GN=Sinac_1308 PE=3 SV=1: Peptidase_M16: Peptidase_M16_C: Peptidase_M16: Peptidase_M16_C [Tuwongella immobilis]VTS01211.1 peptidase m16 domain-containing protein : Putative Zn-dependent peptidase OS=Singulisphaera acidiphila (strain ATCC BAA-1392 / DSM 18658 / VKM B-2454 / MOB10) 